jgi:hypothetical protein
MKALDIILPLRNPTAAFERTVESLVAQVERGFTVLISDNHSGTGVELITASKERLRDAGIEVRSVRPPLELSRVEHWNWAMLESAADWLKPLFAGDWLEPDYVGSLRRGMADHPSCRYIFCSYVVHRGSDAPVTVSSPWAGRFHTPAEMQQKVLTHSVRRRILNHDMQFGPPSAAAYDRTAFISIGGYATTLPICADSLAFCTLAARFGALGLAEPLCHFNIHEARFSTDLLGRRKDIFRETFIYYGMLAYQARVEGWPLPKFALLQLMARQLRSFLLEEQG